MDSNMTVQQMMDMQRRLFDKYGVRFGWQTYTPENAKDHFLWMLGEAGEVIDALKKSGVPALLEEGEKRDHFVEEMADMTMFLIDTLLCMNVTAEEFSAAYAQKHAYNMTRWD